MLEPRVPSMGKPNEMASCTYDFFHTRCIDPRIRYEARSARFDGRSNHFKASPTAKESRHIRIRRHFLASRRRQKAKSLTLAANEGPRTLSRGSDIDKHAARDPEKAPRTARTPS